MSADDIELVAFNRGPRHDPTAEVVRWSLDTFTPQGRPDRPAQYVSARIWFRGSDGAMHPTRRGITIRVGELVTVIKALVRVARQLGLDLGTKPAPSTTGGADG